MLNRTLVVGTVNNFPEQFCIMEHPPEIILRQSQTNSLLKIYGEPSEGNHLPVIVFRQRRKADIVVLRDYQHVPCLRFKRDQIDVMGGRSFRNQHNAPQFYILWRMKNICSG